MDGLLLAGKIAVVSGSTQGIGRAMAIGFGQFLHCDVPF